MRLLRSVLVTGLCVVAVQGAEARGRDPVAPPAPPPFETGEPVARPPFRADAVEYLHGDPTGEEQLFLELMNRARRDPVAESERVFNNYGDPLVKQAVDFFIRARPGVEFSRAENRAAFAGYPAQPPFAFNAKLMTAARLHTQEMKDADLQSHQLPGELALGARVQAQGYAFSQVGESVFASAESMLYAHAGFAIDWGQGLSGGRPVVGHRNALMNFDGNANFTEVGVGVLVDTNPGTDVGPRLITIDFGRSGDTVRFVTGVCFQDMDGDDMYDPGEGLEGVRLDSPASSFFNVSTASGGFSLPVPANSGAIQVTATGMAGTSGEIVGTQQFDLTVGSANVRLVVTAPPDAPPPAFVFQAGGTGDASAASTDFPLDAGPFDPAHPEISSLEVFVDLAHAAPADLGLFLRSPAGTEVALFDGGLPSGVGVSGVFGSTLASAGNLGTFAGEGYEGTWTLRVENRATGVPGTLNGWALRIRPTWLRPIHFDGTGLFLSKLTATDSASPAGDVLSLTATLDAGGTTYDASAPTLLRLLNGTTGTELARYDLGTDAVSLKRTIGRTSEVSLKTKLVGLDLPTLPSPLRVEVSVGGAVVGQTIPFIAGGYRAAAQQPASPTFVIDAISSKLAGAVRTTTVTGRALAPLDVTGIVEVFVGDTVVKLAASSLKTKGTVRSYTSGVTQLRKFTLNTATGAFTAKIVSDHDIVVGGTAPVGLRIGASYFDTAVRPTVKGATTSY